MTPYLIWKCPVQNDSLRPEKSHPFAQIANVGGGVYARDMSTFPFHRNGTSAEKRHTIESVFFNQTEIMDPACEDSRSWGHTVLGAAVGHNDHRLASAQSGNIWPDTRAVHDV